MVRGSVPISKRQELECSLFLLCFWTARESVECFCRRREPKVLSKLLFFPYVTVAEAISSSARTKWKKMSESEVASHQQINERGVGKLTNSVLARTMSAV